MTIERTAPTGTKVQIGSDVVATLGTETVTVIVTPTAPTPTPTPAPPPAPVGTLIPSGHTIPNSGANLLERGGTYSGTLTPASGTTYGTYGDPTKPAPVVNGNVQFDSKTDITIDGIAFRGAGKAGIVGVAVFRSQRIKLLNLSVTGYGSNGINIEGYGGKRCSDVEVRGCLIADNWPADGGKHCEGLYAQDTDGLVLDANVFSTNGGKPGVETVFNHNVYIHAECGPVAVTNNVFHNASSHGLQQRSGGVCRGNLFLDNPIHQSYGLVNGSPCTPGGVTGDISGNVYIGGGTINGAARGWGIELANLKNVTATDLMFAHDQAATGAALMLEMPAGLTNPSQMLPAGQWKLSVSGVYAWDRKVGWLSIGNGIAQPTKGANVGIAPPKSADLHAVLGTGFMGWARQYPAQAAPAAVAKCKAACGIN